MSSIDQAFTFGCHGEHLVGILSQPERSVSDLGVLIIVGGPQYRTGSHRQFVMLARSLARAGYPVLRFDVRGMGDSSGDLRNFAYLSDDIGMAIDQFLNHQSEVRRVVLWGLCDGASAALLYIDERQDSRIYGVCLANPWVRSDVTQARVQVKRYYFNRLTEIGFWRKLIKGQIAVQAWLELRHNLRLAQRRYTSSIVGFQARMHRALVRHKGPVLLIQSGKDLTAAEFDEFIQMHVEWATILQRPEFARVDISDADHTFSESVSRQRCEQATIQWLDRYRGDSPVKQDSISKFLQPD